MILTRGTAPFGTLTWLPFASGPDGDVTLLV